jgi:hypothetical protein
MIKRIFVICACWIALTSYAHATEKMYGLITSGYTNLDFNHQENDGINYSLALGHQFQRQWYAEAGFRQLIDEQSEQNANKASALYLAVLGKAGHQVGELFYKLGVLNIDVDGYGNVDENGGCNFGELSSANRCEYDEGMIGGMVAIGFDYHLSMKTMMRLEIEHIRAENDFKANMINLGIRYNFN